MNNSKNSVRTLTMLALLVAMSIVFSRVLSISTGFVRFNLGSLPVLLAALLFDLIYVFSVTQLSHYLLHNLTWAGLLKETILWFAVWMLW